MAAFVGGKRSRGLLLAAVLLLTALLEGLSMEAAIRQEELLRSRERLQHLQGTDGLSCQLCKNTMLAVQDVLLMAHELILQLAKVVCKTLHLEHAEVCSGAIDRYAPVVLTVFANRYLDPMEICTFLNACDQGGKGQEDNDGLMSTTQESIHKIRKGTFKRVDFWQISQKFSAESKVKTDCCEVSISKHMPGVHLKLRKLPERSATDEQRHWAARWQRLRKGTTKKEDPENFRSHGHRNSDDVRRSSTYEGKRLEFMKNSKGSQFSQMQEQQTGSFLHITDFHFDPAYKEGADIQCLLPLCCQASNGPGPTPNRKAQRLGEFKCDLSEPLLDDLLLFTSTFDNLPPIDFVVYTGDSPPHTIWKDTKESTMKNLQIVHKKMKAAFINKSVYPVIGNHESVPADQFPLPPSDDFLLGELWELWSTWLPGECKATFLHGGFYTLIHEPGLRVVALNTQWWDVMNFWLLNSTRANPDPAGQFEWLEKTLKEAEEKHESVLILGHIPPGDETFYVSYCLYYIDLLERYQHIVVGQLFGHTHSDQFKVYTRKNGDAVGVALLAPSVTPYNGRNPSFRLFSYKKALIEPPVSAKLLNYCNYLLNLTSANKAKNSSEWILGYCAKEQYGLASMEPKEWQKLAIGLRDNDVLWEKFAKNFRAQRPWKCNSACRVEHVCYTMSSTFYDFQTCRKASFFDFSHPLPKLLNSLVKL